MVKNWYTRYGQGLVEQREIVGYQRQTELAKRSIEIASEYPEYFQAFSQQWLSRLENDKTGKMIENAKSKQLKTLAYLLKLDADAFESKIGISIGKVPLLEDSEEGSYIPENLRQNSVILIPMLLGGGTFSVPSAIANYFGLDESCTMVEIKDVELVGAAKERYEKEAILFFKDEDVKVDDGIVIKQGNSYKVLVVDEFTSLDRVTVLGRVRAHVGAG